MITVMVVSLSTSIAAIWQYGHSNWDRKSRSSRNWSKTPEDISDIDQKIISILCQRHDYKAISDTLEDGLLVFENYRRVHSDVTDNHAAD